MEKRHQGKLLTIQEFCKLVKISRSTYFALQGLELGPSTIRIGRAVRIRPREVDAWIDRLDREDEAANFNSKKNPPVYRDW